MIRYLRHFPSLLVLPVLSLATSLAGASAAHAWSAHRLLVEHARPALAAAQSGPAGKLTAAELELLAAHADDPDNGMDQNLPESADPDNERQWMGGTSGPTSQGFRHMYFAGWRLSRPLASFQVPLHAVGKAPERVGSMAREARELLRAGKRQEGLVKLAWAFHYAQDLAQPFHTTQLVHWRMVDFGAFLKSFKNGIAEATRTISNYHYAYESYAVRRLMGIEAPLRPCLADPAKHQTFTSPPLRSGGQPADPTEFALALADSSAKLAWPLGRAQMQLFGSSLKNPGVDLPRDQGTPDYAALLADPRHARALGELDQVSCQALANAAAASRWLIEWAFQP